jgi:hypothetical protein
MTIVAFLQNQWFKDPEGIKQIYERWPDKREKLNAAYLFMGCKTGKNLRKAFGDLCDEIVWEEVSPEIGGHSASSFPPDPEHIKRVIEKHQPDVVLMFGKIAQDGVTPLWRGPKIAFPHPAYRALVPGNFREWGDTLNGMIEVLASQERREKQGVKADG